MGLMDRVKAQATQLAQMTQDAALEGKAKLDQAQSGRRGDALLRSLGAAVFADRTGRGTADTQARIEQLIADISAHERENGLNLVDPPPAVPQPSFPADPPSPFPGPAASTVPGPAASTVPGPAASPFPGADAQPAAGPGVPSFPDAGATFFPGADDSAPSQLPVFFQSPDEPTTPE